MKINVWDKFRSSKEPHDFVPIHWIYNFTSIRMRIVRNRKYKTYWNSGKYKIASPESVDCALINLYSRSLFS